MKRTAAVTVALGILLAAGSPGLSEPVPGQDPAVREMHITGEIARSRHGFIIRGEQPAEVFTILNPDPEKLANYLQEGKTAEIDVRIVSGDNVEIRKIDGKEY